MIGATVNQSIPMFVADAARTVRPDDRLRLGSALAEMSRKIGLTNADVEALEQTRDTKPAEPLRF